MSNLEAMFLLLAGYWTANAGMWATIGTPYWKWFTLMCMACGILWVFFAVREIRRGN